MCFVFNKIFVYVSGFLIYLFYLFFKLLYQSSGLDTVCVWAWDGSVTYFVNSVELEVSFCCTYDFADYFFFFSCRFLSDKAINSFLNHFLSSPFFSHVGDGEFLICWPLVIVFILWLRVLFECYAGGVKQYSPFLHWSLSVSRHFFMLSINCYIIF